MALYLGLGLIFVYFSVLPQITATVFKADLYLPYVVGIPAIVATVLNGGIARAFRARPAYYMAGYGCWMALAVPFSSWRGGSALGCFSYWRTALIMLLVTAGMLLEWSDIRKVMNVIAAAAFVNVLSARLFRQEGDYRMGLSFGTIGNPNDYAGHLLLVLPFLVWVLLKGKLFLRVVAFLTVGAGLYLIVGTGSRGALFALVADLLFLIIMGTPRQKAGVLLLGPIAAIFLLATVPSPTLRRLTSVMTNTVHSAEAEEASESSAAREYVFKTSIRYTFQHPLFGVGPQQFAAYEGGHEHVRGTHGYWHDTHCSFTQASAECGIPGFLFFAGATLSTLLLLYKTLRQARRRPNCQDIGTAVFCIMLGVVGFDVAITFLNFAYFFYFPALAGLATGVWSAAQREFQIRDAALQAGTA
jgi:O-antigen ligase